MSLNTWLGRVGTSRYSRLLKNPSPRFEKKVRHWKFFLLVSLLDAVFANCHLGRKNTAPVLKVSQARKFLRGYSHPTMEDTCGNIHARWLQTRWINSRLK